MVIEFGDRLDPSQCVNFVLRIETGYRQRHSLAHAWQTSVRQGHADFSTT